MGIKIYLRFISIYMINSVMMLLKYLMIINLVFKVIKNVVKLLKYVIVIHNALIKQKLTMLTK